MHSPFHPRARHRIRPALVAVLILGAVATTAAADAALTVTGANASDTVDCRNVAPTPPHGHGAQVNVCNASATGGSVNLDNVDVYFNVDSTVQANGGAVDIVKAVGGSASANAVCQNSGSQTGTQVNICRANATGGNVQFSNVQIVLEHSDGSVTSIKRNLLALAPTRASRVAAVCTPLTSVSTCGGTASGASLVINDVDVVDGATGTTRTHVSIALSGGNASATVICGNVGSVRIQVNKCTATAIGGNVLLHDVRLHVFQTSPG